MKATWLGESSSFSFILKVIGAVRFSVLDPEKNSSNYNGKICFDTVLNNVIYHMFRSDRNIQMP